MPRHKNSSFKGATPFDVDIDELIIVYWFVYQFINSLVYVIIYFLNRELTIEYEVVDVD